MTASQGQINFNDVIVTGLPGSTFTLKVSPISINAEKVKKAFNVEMPDIYLYGNIRLCIRGEYQSTDNKCIMCSEGFYTLLDNQTQCEECPLHATCMNGDEIKVDNGYWRPNISTNVIYECFNVDACPSNSNITCATGYGGNLCQSCVKAEDAWYIQEGLSECSPC